MGDQDKEVDRSNQSLPLERRIAVEMMVNNVISKIIAIPDFKMNPIFVFTGSHVMRKDSRDKSKWGWGQVIDHYNLEVVKTITLPTYWTLDQPVDTPFIFARSIV